MIWIQRGVMRVWVSQSCPAVDERVAHLADDGGRALALELERGLDNADLGRGCVKASERAPVINYETCADDVRTTVHCAGL